MSERKVYYIPRRVTARFKVAGLGTKEILILLPIVFLAVIIDFLTPLPIGAKIIGSTFLLGGAYGILTQEVGNMLALEYIKLNIKYYVFDQNVYTLTIQRKKPKEDIEKVKVLTYSRRPLTSELLKEKQERIVSEWNSEAPQQEQYDKEADLEELADWIAKPRQLTNKR